MLPTAGWERMVGMWGARTIHLGYTVHVGLQISRTNHGAKYGLSRMRTFIYMRARSRYRGPFCLCLRNERKVIFVCALNFVIYNAREGIYCIPRGMG
jgi:hypothetical protein